MAFQSSCICISSKLERWHSQSLSTISVVPLSVVVPRQVVVPRHDDGTTCPFIEEWLPEIVKCFPYGVISILERFYPRSACSEKQN